jgi:hypothetical protein
VSLPDFLDELCDQTKEPRWGEREAEQPAKLAGDDAEGDAIQIAGQNGSREKVRQKTEPPQSGCNAERAGDQGQRHRQ